MAEGDGQTVLVTGGSGFLGGWCVIELLRRGYTGGAGAFPTRVLAPTLGIAAADFPALPAMPQDLLIVEKRNPVDP